MSRCLLRSIDAKPRSSLATRSSSHCLLANTRAATDVPLKCRKSRPYNHLGKCFPFRHVGQSSTVEKRVRSAAKPWRISKLSEGKRRARSGGRGGQEPTRRSHTPADAVPPQQCEHLEEPRAYHFSRHRYTHGVNQRSRFHTTRIGGPAQHFFRRPGLERVERRH